MSAPHALRRNSSRFRLTIWFLVVALVGTSAFSFWKLSALRREKLTIDARIRQIEIKLEQDETPQEAERLISELSTYQDEARSLERNVLYRYAVRQQQNFITNEIRAVMRVVEDPIKQRNFWYLYRTRALPPETREYVPKVFAAIIIGRNPARFEF